jgi:hypothetical protein
MPTPGPATGNTWSCRPNAARPLLIADAQPREQTIALSDAEGAELDRLGIENVRLKLANAGPGASSSVPGLGPGFEAHQPPE